MATNEKNIVGRYCTKIRGWRIDAGERRRIHATITKERKA